MKKYLLIYFLFTVFTSTAQIDTQWVNRFCCFDSIAPHSFSYPFGIVTTNDSAVIAYFEDDTVKIKIVDLISGNDIADFNCLTDSILPSFNYGGDFKKCNGGFILANNIMRDGSPCLVFSKVLNNFTVDSIGCVVSSFEKPTRMISLGDTSFFIAFLSDSIHIININTETNSITQFSYENISDELYHEIFINALNELILIERLSVSASHFLIRIKKIDIVSGVIIQSANIFSAANFSHACFKKDDSLYIAFNNTVVGDVGFTTVNLNTLNQGIATNTPSVDFVRVINFKSDNNWQKYYIESYSRLIQINPDHSVGFIKDLPGRSFMPYNQSPILFDANDNPVLFFSYVNNTIINEDLILMRIDKNTGNTIDSLVYNDIRQTPDIAITHFFDNNGHLNLLFANDYDDNVILQEETQLNILQLNTLSNDQIELPVFAPTIYPNPTTGKLFFVLPEIDRKKIQVFNYSGKLMELNSSDSEFGIDISGCADGIYLIKITDGNRIESLFKVIKSGN